MSRDLGRDVPDLEKLSARKLWADVSHPKTAPTLEYQHEFHGGPSVNILKTTPTPIKTGSCGVKVGVRTP